MTMTGAAGAVLRGIVLPKQQPQFARVAREWALEKRGAVHALAPPREPFFRGPVRAVCEANTKLMARGEAAV